MIPGFWVSGELAREVYASSACRCTNLLGRRILTRHNRAGIKPWPSNLSTTPPIEWASSVDIDRNQNRLNQLRTISTHSQKRCTKAQTENISSTAKAVLPHSTLSKQMKEQRTVKKSSYSPQKKRSTGAKSAPSTQITLSRNSQTS